MSLSLQPVTFAEACEFVRRYHRHHPPAQGHKFSIGANDGEKVVGVVCVGRPVARYFDNGWTLEVTRCCTDGTRNACSLLYGAAWRAAKALGYRRVVTYTLRTEPGTSLRAAGWKDLGPAGGGSWHTPNSGRPRVDLAPTAQKTLWEVAA